MTNQTVTLSGTAATGAPFVGTMNITDSNGDQLSDLQIQTDGTFSVNIFTLIPPLMIQAIPADSNMDILYSYISASSIGSSTTAKVNITPLTSLALFIALDETDLETYYNNWASNAAGFSDSDLIDAQAVTNANLEQVYTDNGIDHTTYDFFSASFAADGTGIDAVLDAIDVDLSNGIDVTVDGDAGFSFDSNIDTTGIDIGGDDNGGGNNLTVYDAIVSIQAVPFVVDFYDLDNHINATAYSVGVDFAVTNNEGINFGNENAPLITERRLLFLATSGSLDAIPAVPDWSNTAPWVTVSWDFVNGTAGAPIAAGQLWAVYTSEGKYAVMEITFADGVPGGDGAFGFDYVILDK